ncbi:MAG: hypothetical protein RJA90_1159 [Bacteroidota bacterium]
MAKIENKDTDVEMHLRAIELLNSSLTLPANPDITVLVFVIVHIDIKNDGHSEVLGALSVSCIFDIVNFEDVIKIEADGKVNIPQRLIETLNIISISTTRGVMFSTFKGTFLHSAILPIIDPQQLNTDS